MRNLEKCLKRPLTALFVLLSFALQAQETKVTVNWNKTDMISTTTPTLQVVGNPMLRSASPIHGSSFSALKTLGADYVRYVPWFPYTRLAVAELYPPDHTKTYWDFTLLDSMMNDFMTATDGHPVVINFSTIPVWMFRTESHPVTFPDDPNEVFWGYNEGTDLRDPTLKEVAGYYSRLVSWYTQGGFTDELGKYHRSGHFYKIPYWEVLNEPDLEHQIPVKEYTRIYDAVVTAIRKIAPATKFVGISLAFSNDPEWFNYFLNPKNHQPGVPLDAISYHFYASPVRTQNLDQYQYSFFDQATGFLNKVRYIESIRKRLSPKTKTMINEVGSIISPENDIIPDNYWNLSGAMFAYLFLEMTKQGIDVAGESQLVGFPTQFPDVSMMDWKNGQPNARYWVLKLLKDNLGAGDKLVETIIAGGNQALVAQGYQTKKGKALLLINLRNAPLTVRLPEAFARGNSETVDETTGEAQAQKSPVAGGTVTLRPFAVSLVQP